MPGNRRCVAAIALLGASFALPACGSEREATIPRAEGEELLAQLDRVEASVEAGECDVAEQEASRLSVTVAQLPAEVDTEVKSTLLQASERLIELTREPDQCREEEEEPTTTTTTPTPTTTTTTTEPPTTTTDEPTTTTTTTTTDTETEDEDEDGGPQGGGTGGGTGGGNAGGGGGAGGIGSEE